MCTKKLLEFKWVLSALLLGLISFGFGLYLGLCKEPEWFSRFGSLMVLCGVITEYQVGRLPFIKGVLGTDPNGTKLSRFSIRSTTMWYFLHYMSRESH